MKNDISVFIMSRSRYVRMQKEMFAELNNVDFIFEEE